mgnify:CR=1 FL=1
MKKITAIQRHPLVIACALAAAGAVLFVSEASYWRSTTTLQELTEMGMARTQIQTLERSMLDAETGQRGYLLTQRKEYLEPYATALIRIEDAYKVLDAYYGSDPESQALLQRLHTLTETKLSELALTLQLFDEGRGKAGREILMTDIGREKMDAIRATSAELLAYQTRAVSDSRSALISTLVLDRLGVAVLSLVSLLALFLYLRQSQALKLQQMELQRVVQLERDRLEVEVANRTAELIELAQHLQTAREDERQRLARNLLLRHPRQPLSRDRLMSLARGREHEAHAALAADDADHPGIGDCLTHGNLELAHHVHGEGVEGLRAVQCDGGNTI